MSAVGSLRPSLPVLVFRALRVSQWTKNGVLLAPLLFARGIFEKWLLVHALAAVFAFSLLASGVYVINDWFDREKDRLHPEKRKRPIAAGHLSGSAAIALVVLCWGGAAAVGWYVGPGFLGVMGGYLVLQVPTPGC